jgi:hypothetical protein
MVSADVGADVAADVISVLDVELTEDELVVEELSDEQPASTMAKRVGNTYLRMVGSRRSLRLDRV